MTDLIMPSDGPRVGPLSRKQVSPYVLAEYDKSIHTWGIPNNLIRTMACLPQLGLTEVDYANSFIFDEGVIAGWPDPANPDRTVPFPMAGFVDRVTKELIINLVSLLNRSRYSITHHTVIGWSTLSSSIDQGEAEEMLLSLVNGEGEASYKYRTDLFSDYQIAAMDMAVQLRGDAHDVSDQDFKDLRAMCEVEAAKQIQATECLAGVDAAQSPEYLRAYVNGMLVELTWCTVHFAGLLNKWFTVMKVCDETDAGRDGIDFVTVYNSIVPESIKVRNNALLGPDGWGKR